MNVDTDKIISRFETYSKIFKKYFPCAGAERFLEDYGTRLATCPRGLTEDDGGYHGALVEFLSNVAIRSKEISEGVCSQKSAIRVSLVHELGKLGSLENELFLEQESSWHREKLGQNFKYNDKCKRMTVSHRTLFLLQEYNIDITLDEWISIYLSQGMHLQEAGFYAKSRPILSSVLEYSRSLEEA